MHINMSNHALNRNDDAYLPQKYMACKKPRCDFRSPLMKTRDWSVESWVVIAIQLGFAFIFKTRVASENMIVHCLHSCWFFLHVFIRVFKTAALYKVQL